MKELLKKKKEKKKSPYLLRIQTKHIWMKCCLWLALKYSREINLKYDWVWVGKGWHWVMSLRSYYTLLCRRQWQPTPVLSPGKSHRRSLVGCSPWGRTESESDLAAAAVAYSSICVKFHFYCFLRMWNLLLENKSIRLWTTSPKSTHTLSRSVALRPSWNLVQNV